MASNMTKRVGFAVVAIPLVVITVWAGGWPLAALLMLATQLGTMELIGIAEHQGLKPFRGTARVVAVAVPLAMGGMLVNSTVNQLLNDWWMLLALGTVLWIMALAVMTRTPADKPLGSVAVTLFAIVYATLLPVALFYIRHAIWPQRSWAATAMVFFPLVVTWVCDSAAMFGGGMLGGPKLAPTISPGKTRSGAICGVVGGALVGAVYAAVIFPRIGVAIGVGSAAALALVFAIVGQVGDLAESLFKREAGVKDSSALIPGHGGVLDRLDSLYFVIPVAAAGYHLLGLI